MSMGGQGASAVLVYLWALQDAPGEAMETKLISLAKAYGQSMGMDLGDTGGALAGWPGPLERDAKGKPFFSMVYPDLHFSLSHSGAYGACAFARQPVGLDMQIHTNCDGAKIAKRFFHPEEQAYLAQQGQAAFFAVWVAKESYVKYTGEGISGGFGQFAVADANGLKYAIDGVCFRHWPVIPGYSLCLCAREAKDACLIQL